MAHIHVLISNIQWRAEANRRYAKHGGLPESFNMGWPSAVTTDDEMENLRDGVMEILDDRYSYMPKSFDVTVASTGTEAVWLLSDADLLAAFHASGGEGERADRLCAEIQRRGLDV